MFPTAMARYSVTIVWHTNGKGPKHGNEKLSGIDCGYSNCCIFFLVVSSYVLWFITKRVGFNIVSLTHFQIKCFAKRIFLIRNQFMRSLAYCTRHDASRYIAMRRVALYALLSVHTGKALPDIVGYNGVTTTRHASRSRFTDSGNSLNCIVKTKKKRLF